MTDHADLRRLAEQATPHPAETRASRLHAFHIAANPQAILALTDALDAAEAKVAGLLDERDHWQTNAIANGRDAVDAERRVAALEAGLRARIERWQREADGLHADLMAANANATAVNAARATALDTCAAEARALLDPVALPAEAGQ